MKRRLNIFETLNKEITQIKDSPQFIPSKILNDFFVLSFESNAFTIRTEYNISEDVIFSILSIYGQIENFKIESNSDMSEISISYYDTRATKRAYSEISFNFEKLLNYQTEKYSLAYSTNKKDFYEKYLLIIKYTSLEEIEKILNLVDFHSQIDKIYKNENELLIRFYNLKDKIRMLFFLGKMINTENEYPKEKASRTEEYIRSIQIYREDQKKTETEIVRKTVKILSLAPIQQLSQSSSQKVDNKDNIPLKKCKKEEKENYKILYDKNYSGIKKRNTPADEIQNYVINIQDIINEKDTRTTLMVKNIPSYITQLEVLEKINKNHSNNYNFFYLPIDFNKKSNAGYAFINFKSAKTIINFFLEFNNKPWGFKDSNKISYVSYARIQGFRALSSHFKKSHIMKQVDEKVKPIIFNN